MSAQKKWEIAVSERQMDSARKEIPEVFFTTGLVLVKEHNHSLSLPRRRLRLTEERLTYFALHEERVLLDSKAENRVKKFLKGKVHAFSVWFMAHPPVCLKYKSESGCKYGGEGLVGLLKETIQLGCVSNDSRQKKSILREMKNWDQIAQSSSRRPRCVTQKFAKRRVPPRGSLRNAILKSEFFFLGKRKMKSSGKSGAPAKQPGTWDVDKLNRESQKTVYSPAEAWVMPAPSSKKPEE